MAHIYVMENSDEDTESIFHQNFTSENIHMFTIPRKMHAHDALTFILEQLYAMRTH